MPSLPRILCLVAQLPLLIRADHAATRKADEPDLDFLANLLDAMNVMQQKYYKPWQGTWPDSIDWTGAVIDTHLSAGTRSFSEALPLLAGHADWQLKANVIDTFFSQIIGYYFGEKPGTIMQEAYDDILWVSLGWNEAIKFVNTHTDLHFSAENEASSGLGAILANQTYYGNNWVSTFSNRAEQFWLAAENGWDETLCGGGMNWNPAELPYKNAITNELWIAASMTMYNLYPGDNDGSPYNNPNVEGQSQDSKYLDAARKGYEWMKKTKFLNNKGLYIDGFHISDIDNGGTTCDERNTQVYTYNQGVILTGLRGLHDAEGGNYLADGHLLIRSAINATGWDLENDGPIDQVPTSPTNELPPWRGMGRLGIMEEVCDVHGTCSQDAQSFKGIYFHHLANFCEGLPKASDCSPYTKWLKWNTDAALATRDDSGRFGMWWTAGVLQDEWAGPWPNATNPMDAMAVDYRNKGIPNNPVWRGTARVSTSPTLRRDGSSSSSSSSSSSTGTAVADAESTVEAFRGEAEIMIGDHHQQWLGPVRGHAHQTKLSERHTDLHHRRAVTTTDPNARGRGRTVETQSGGVGLLRAYWKIGEAP